MRIIINVLEVFGAIFIWGFVMMIVALLKAKQGGEYGEEIFFNGNLADYDSLNCLDNDSDKEI